MVIRRFTTPIKNCETFSSSSNKLSIRLSKAAWTQRLQVAPCLSGSSEPSIHRTIADRILPGPSGLKQSRTAEMASRRRPIHCSEQFGLRGRNLMKTVISLPIVLVLLLFGVTPSKSEPPLQIPREVFWQFPQTRSTSCG
jgi:hypothetical protein